MSNETHSHSNVVIIWSHIWGFDKSLYSELSCRNSCDLHVNEKQQASQFCTGGGASSKQRVSGRKVKSCYYDFIIIFGISGSRTTYELMRTPKHEHDIVHTSFRKHNVMHLTTRYFIDNYNLN